MNEDVPIAEHALIGDLQTSALVTTDGTIDFFCCPRFDSPSVFSSLLDRNRGGYFAISPVSSDYSTRQLYLPGTSILITRFMASEGVGELIDFMPVLSDCGPTATHRIVRILRVVRGQMRFVLDCQPRFDYGRRSHKTEITAEGTCRFRADGDSELALHVVRRRADLPPSALPQPEHFDLGIRAFVDVAQGEVGGVVLESAPDGPPRELSPAEIWWEFERTRDFWREWIDKSSYVGRWRESVERSAITLKLLTYEPTGAPIAAPTFGLPEQPGGERNWDYRYTWIRDGSFSVRALLGLGYVDEAEAFLHWIGSRIDAAVDRVGDPPLRIMYRVDGSSDLDEQTLEDLDGWRASRPLRVGNGASDQLQLDIYGEALDSMYLGDMHGIPLTHAAWEKITHVIDWLCENWDRADAGIWETRGGPQHFTYGRLMSWVAFDRSIRLAREHARPADLNRWTRVRDAIYNEIMTNSWDERRGTFVQSHSAEVLDAALLYMPLVGFISPRDMRWQKTLDAIKADLVSDSLVFRYDPEMSPDGLRGSEGTFSICTFWYVEALTRSGRLDEARLTFEKMLTYANHVGLYAEEIGPTGEQLGNFPQAFSHLSLINAALNLDRVLDSDGRGVAGIAMPTLQTDIDGSAVLSTTTM
jgi:GH15 family glucan-1,4-alpha-glucosidase